MLIKRLLSLGALPRNQTRELGPRIGSMYIAASFGISGVLTYVFQGMSARFLGLAEFGALAVLWSATLLLAAVLWIGITQTLARYVAEREARGEDWGPVVASARRLALLMLVGFLVVALFLSPLLTEMLFGGRAILTVAFMVAIVGYSFSYFRYGMLSGHRQFLRVGGIVVAESASRVIIAAGLLVMGVGIAGPAIGIALAPLASVVLVRLAPVAPPRNVGAPFNIGRASRFATPVLVSAACAQILLNGGVLLISRSGDPDAYAQAGLLVAVLTLVRAPLNMLGTAVTNLLPHLSRMAALEDHRQFTLLAWQAVAFIGFVGIVLVSGMWLLGNVAMTLLYGPEFTMSRALLAVLAVFAACHLLCMLLNQMLLAKGLAWFAAIGWLLGILVTVGSMLALQTEIFSRVAYALALGTASTAAAQALFLQRSKTVRPTGTHLR